MRVPIPPSNSVMGVRAVECYGAGSHLLLVEASNQLGASYPEPLSGSCSHLPNLGAPPNPAQCHSDGELLRGLLVGRWSGTRNGVGGEAGTI